MQHTAPVEAVEHGKLAANHEASPLQGAPLATLAEEEGPVSPTGSGPAEDSWADNNSAMRLHASGTRGSTDLDKAGVMAGQPSPLTGLVQEENSKMILEVVCGFSAVCHAFPPVCL